MHPNDPKLESMLDITREPGWEDTTYPCILHGDGGTYTRKTQSSILIVSLKSIVSEVFAENIVPGIVLSSHVRVEQNDATATEIWDAYVHLLNWAYRGRHAPVDHHGDDWPVDSPQAALAGKPLCGGKRFVIFY